MSFDFAQDEVEMLIEHCCEWKTRLILSEVEGSGPNLSASNSLPALSPDAHQGAAVDRQGDAGDE